MNTLKELKAKLEESSFYNEWDEILAFTKEGKDAKEGIRLVEAKLKENWEYYEDCGFSASEYLPDHPLFKYSTTYYGELPSHWEPEALANIESLYLSGVGVDTNEGIAKVGQLSNALTINIDSSAVEDVSALFDLEKVTRLKFSFCRNIKTIKGIGKMRSLEEFGHMPNAAFDVASLNELTQIKRLELDGGRLEELGDLSQLKDLKSLDLSWNRIKSLNGIEGMKVLRKLLCFNCEQLSDISALKSIKTIEYLNLFGCVALQDVEALGQLKKLYYLQLKDSNNLEVKPKHMTLEYDKTIATYLKKVKKYYKANDSKETAIPAPPKDKMSKSVLEIVQEWGKLTFTELVLELKSKGEKPDGKQKFAVEGYDNVLLWDNLSDKLVKALRNLEKTGFIKFEKFSDNFDGAMYLDRTEKDHYLRKIPLAKRKMKYKEARWMPHWIVDIEHQPAIGGLSFF